MTGHLRVERVGAERGRVLLVLIRVAVEDGVEVVLVLLRRPFGPGRSCSRLVRPRPLENKGARCLPVLRGLMRNMSYTLREK